MRQRIFARMQWQLTELKRSDGIRWAVGAPTERRSSTWRLWGNKKGDLYLAARSLGGTLKTSFHRDGRCHTGLTTDYASRVGAQQRHMDRWIIPVDAAAMVAQAVYPEDGLSVFAANDTDQMRWLPTPPPNWVSVVSLFVLPTADMPKLQEAWPAAEHGAEPVGVISTQLRTAFVVHKQNELGEEQRRDLQALRARAKAEAGDLSVHSPSSLRIILFGHRPDGARFFVDAALGAAG